jgi:hypothetical protein
MQHVNYNSNRYNLGGGFFDLSAHCGHINFNDQGSLRAINTQLNFAAGAFEQLLASYHARLPEFANDWIYFNDRFEGKNITLGLRPVCNKVLGVQDVDGKGVFYADAFGVDRHISLRCGNNSLRKEIVITSKPSGTNDLDFDFEITADAALRSDAKQLIDKSNFTTNKHLFIGDQEIPTKIHQATAWDANGRTVPVSLRFYKSGNRFYVRKSIPRVFLNRAIYPISTDASATYYSGAGDGWVLYFVAGAAAADWDTAHHATTGTDSNDTNTSTLPQSNQGGGETQIIRGFIPIDTSGLDDAAVISAATVSAQCFSTDNTDNDGDDWITLVQTSQASNTALTTADYNTCGNPISNPSEGVDSGQRKDISGLSTSVYTVWTLNSTGIGWIDATGYTKLGFREGHDAQDIRVAGNNRARFYTSEQTGTSQDPKIDITYTVPAGGLSGSLGLMGVGF